ncbi:macro domain-containing protein [Sulfurimonas sp. C5]|uniref:macro domain-containing protein n=1 Tax=Sulfurimonas sp. C5 TaxID=3036947 RepID=UPI00245404B3|nr:macro domain-containing protein [Sulfurimonas sp. C5]MDH4943887.1 macro domain-containing protein [Sulfurimonas sp. C5]
MIIKIKYGNLVEEQSTFIVNASNTELQLGSGVSRAFYEQCGGSSFQEELNELKKNFNTIRQGDVLISSSGTATNFQYALHIAVMNYSDPTKSPLPTYEHIKNALKNTINIVNEKIENEHIENPKLVIPLLGCGVGGLEKEKVFSIIKKSFEQTDMDLEVIIYLHNQKDYLEFSMKE